MGALPRRKLQELVGLQLGRRPGIAFHVRVYCGYGWPAVIENDACTPSGEPNPNLYYLTCPYLRRELAVLEDGGWIERVHRMALQQQALRKQLAAAQREHAALWRRKAGRDWPGPDERGPRIAAAGDDLAIKCLHAHFAWFLVNEDHEVGQVLLKAIGERWCRDDRCASLSL
ncbi:MAG: DUF501 domain-containing protein [Gaiellales bacterium]|nr:MAG: DUF501 domain-containing protein [Gaiellales bacterium]